MKTLFRSPAFVALLITALAVVVSPSALAVEKKERTKKRSGTYSTSEGKSGALEGSVTRSKGKVNRESSATNQDGKTATSVSERTWDKETGTGAFARTTTGPEGKTASVNSVSKRNDDGTISTEGSRTGFNGKTGTFENTTTKTDDGRTTSGTIAGAGGKMATTSSSVTHAHGETHKVQTVTGPNGKTAEREIASKKNGDGTFTRTLLVTHPDGTTSTRTETYTPASP